MEDIIKKSHFLENLVALLFKYPCLSIVHKIVEKAFTAIFMSEKRVCEEYRKYLFCSAGVIELTAGECLSRASKIA